MSKDFLTEFTLLLKVSKQKLAIKGGGRNILGAVFIEEALNIQFCIIEFKLTRNFHLQPSSSHSFLLFAAFKHLLEFDNNPQLSTHNSS